MIAAPEANAYLGYFNGLSEAKKLLGNGQYSDAISKLKSINQRLLLPKNRDLINQTLLSDQNIKKDDDIFQQAKQDEQQGNFDDAKKLLTTLSDKKEYPALADVIKEVSNVDDAISAKTKADADAKIAAAQTSQQKAQEDAARSATAAAESNARAIASKAAADAASAAKAQSDAAAEANATAAAESAAVAQEQAAKAAQQARISFYNQLTSMLGSINSGTGYYNQAMADFNSGSNYVAISIFGQALAVYQGVYTNAGNLSSTFTGMPSSYLLAAQNLTSAANDYVQATNVMINNCSQNVSSVVKGSYNDPALYSSQGIPLAADVQKQFLSTTTP